MRTRLKAGADRETTRIVVVYAVVGSAWIYFSDTLLDWLISDPALMARIEVFKGIFFILFTSALLFHLIASFARRNADTIAQLAESEARFQAIYHNVNDALLIHDAATGRILDVNRSMCSMFGYSHDEALRLTIQDISLGAAPYSESEALEYLDLAAMGLPQIFEWRSRKKDGTLFWSEVNMRSATINGEKRTIVMVRDITSRKEAEEALRRNEESLKDLMEGMPAGVCWTNEAGKIEYENGCIVDWFGYTLADIGSIDEWMQRALPDPEQRERFKAEWRCALAATQANAPPAPIEAGITCRDGSRMHVILNIRRVNNLILYIFTDITKRESQQSEILKTQKLESLGVLAGGIAHDFNNILTGILGNISFAGLLLDHNHPARKPVEQAEKASLRAAELAHQLLTFARGGQPVKKAVSVGSLVQESLSLTLHGSKVRSIVDIPASLDAVEADEGQMNQAFNNVIINALQAMPEGGILAVRGENVTVDGGNNPGLAAGRYVRISFSDQGCGIPQTDLQRIFDPYFTTKSGGTGLGLASVHSIVNKHNGKIEVTSVPGKGTTFVFYLPSAAEPAHEPECEPPPESLQNESKGAILVMDDEEQIRSLTADILEYLGYRVTTCVSGEDAVRLYKEAKGTGAPYVAAIMDLTVPAGMGGKEAALEILTFDPSARLIVSSGYSNDPVMANHADYGFRAAIIKPYRCAEIQHALTIAEA